MAQMGNGYGSECHLLRYLGRHRGELDRRVLETIGSGERIEWIDFVYDRAKRWSDGEWKGLDFVTDRPDVQEAWRNFWPQGAGIQNWDAVGWLLVGSDHELILVEAKANVEEIRSDCGAKPEGGLGTIERALDETKQALGVDRCRDWLRGYYQYANRLAVLHFLTRHDVKARLVYIYFVGDRSDDRRTCPASIEEWKPCLVEQDRHLGLPEAHPLSGRIHKVFLHVASASL